MRLIKYSLNFYFDYFVFFFPIFVFRLILSSLLSSKFEEIRDVDTYKSSHENNEFISGSSAEIS